MTDGWICEGGHPYYLIDGEKYCPLCTLIEQVGRHPVDCRNGHARPATGHRSCRLCDKYRKRPYWRELDEKGEAVCPNGHRLTHETVAYSKQQGVWVERSCPSCRRENVKNANAAYVAKREALAAAEGREIRRRAREEDTLAVDYLDWVVAYRLAMGKVDEVYEMRRGRHKGATPMEKWVAYCSTHGRDPEEFRRNQPSGVRIVRGQWAEYANEKGWPPKTLIQAMAE